SVWYKTALIDDAPDAKMGGLGNETGSPPVNRVTSPSLTQGRQSAKGAGLEGDVDPCPGSSYRERTDPAPHERDRACRGSRYASKAYFEVCLPFRRTGRPDILGGPFVGQGVRNADRGHIGGWQALRHHRRGWDVQRHRGG